MSAFICKSETYSDIYSGFRLYGESGSISLLPLHKATGYLLDYIRLKHAGPDLHVALVQELYGANVRAVNQRYGTLASEVPDNKQLKQMCTLNSNIPLIQFFKSLECLVYQMNEGDVPHSVLFKHMMDVKGSLCQVIVHTSNSYQQAEWR